MTTESPLSPHTPLADLWDDQAAAALSEPDLLLYRSHLLGSDLRITNYGGGNTSAKIPMKDPLTGASVDVLWVKGSGGDLGSMGLDGFATLYMDKLLALEGLYRGPAHEDEMVDYLPHCTFNLNPRAASIDTPPHGFMPPRHIDHMHPDAVIAIAAMRNGRRIAEEIFGDEIGWMPWQRPGFELGLKLREMIARRPVMSGVILASHGLITWGSTSRACYRTTIRTIQRAADWLSHHRRAEPFGPAVASALADGDRRALLAEVAPVLRGLLSPQRPKVMHCVDSPAVLEFAGARRAEALAELGTTCPDHFLRTRVRPLFVPFAPGRDSADELVARLPGLVDRYRDTYAAYYERCRHPDSPAMRDPFPVLVLIPGLGLLAFQQDAQTARLAAEFYINTINVMRDAEGVDEYVPMSEQDAFDIEYWRLEEAKLQRLPRPKILHGRVAFVTGAAGGIGGATSRRLLAEGASVVLADVDQVALDAMRDDLIHAYGTDRVRAVGCDVTDQASVVRALAQAVGEYGGIDVLVLSAGVASAAPVDETSLDLWQRNLDILATGYFLVAREGFRVLKRQGRGGSIVVVGSKNALVASPGASAYCAAKAAAVHLARCLAVEGAEHGIRVNVVNPDAVIRGSRIWSGAWRAERAAGYKIPEAQVEEFYRLRSLLKRSVYPEDVAEAILFFASDGSAKSTGNVINVDAGQPAAFTR